MKEEMETIKLRSGNQLARENYLLLNKSKAQILNILLNTEEKMENLQSQLKEKEEVITKLKQWLEEEKPTKDMNENFIIIRLSDLKAKIQELEILSKGENK